MNLDKPLSYSMLQKRLGMTSVRALEDLLIVGLYNSVFTGRLDHERLECEVTATIGRDVDVGLESAHSTSDVVMNQPTVDGDLQRKFLKGWAVKAEGVQAWIEEQIQALERKQKERENAEKAAAVAAK